MDISTVLPKLLKGIRRKSRRTLSLFFFCFVKKRNCENLKRFKGRHEGRRAFIICNGPSLKPEDLDKIHKNGDISFASNKIDKIFSKTKWRPTYYTVMDEGYQYTLLKTMRRVPAKAKFFRNESFYVTCRAKGNCIWLNTDGGHYLLDTPKFSEDASNVIYTIGTVTYAMIQLAVYMGVKEIYIIGCDNSYSIMSKKDGSIVRTGHNSHFTGSDCKDLGGSVAVWQMNVAYECARTYADGHDIKIMNATRGGYLETFERVDFATLF